MAINPYNLSETDAIESTQGIGALSGLDKYGQPLKTDPLNDPTILRSMEQGLVPELPQGALGAFEYPVYQVETFAPESSVNLQDVYGTEAMPIFEWAKQIQSGIRIYDPSSPVDQELIDQYKQLTGELSESGQLPPDAPSWEDIAKPIAAVAATKIGANVAQALTDPYIVGGVTDKVLAGGQTSIPYFGKDLPQQTINKSIGQGWDMSKAGGIPKDSVFIPELATQEAAAASSNLDLYNRLNSGPSLGSGSSGVQELSNGSRVYNTDSLGKSGVKINGDQATGLQSSRAGGSSLAISSTTKAPTYWDGVQGRFTDSATWSQAGTMALVSTGINIAMGMKPVEAVKAGSSAAFAYAVGTALFGPVGGYVASTFLAAPIQKAGSKINEKRKQIASDVAGEIKDAGSRTVSAAKKVVAAPVKVAKKIISGGRVICNELRRQGLLTTRDVVLDYKFTQEHLTPQHVAGYHFWAIKVVKNLRKGKGIKLWTHIAQHRANEISYIYGDRANPDYLGKIYRKIFEPVCWTVGLFCKEADWSILYEDKQEN
tara:strand:+ start:948 stop:2576 length:1629 start_codon:yes stop_codon:yes gene_type:complete